MELKTKRRVFIDSSGWKALVDKKDDFYEEGWKIWNKLLDGGVDLLTSNYILDESLTLVRLRCGLDKALVLREFLFRGEPKIKVARVLAQDETEAWKWFVKDWSKLSFTDCVSFAVMERLGLKEVFAFDRHFEKAGFSLVTRERL